MGALVSGYSQKMGLAVVQEVQIPANGEWREVGFVATPDTDSIMIRNSSQRGPSCASVRIVGIAEGTEDTRGAEGLQALPTPAEVVIDQALFAKFKCWCGRIPPGFTANWSGVMTRAEFEAWPPDVIAAIQTERSADVRVPFDSELVLDWAPMLEALVRAKSVFRMAALGAGWGRWLTGGAFLARQIGLDYRLLGVEAEPQHFAWMVQHMDDNGIESNKRILLNAAASGHPAFVTSRSATPNTGTDSASLAKQRNARDAPPW